MMVEIRLNKSIDFKGMTFVEGFPGAGLVGPMTISYMIEKLKPVYIGYIEGDELPPIMSVHSGTPMPSIRLYYSKEGRFVCILSEYSIPPELVYPISDKIIKFVRDGGFSEIISIGGMPVRDGDEKYLDTVFSISSNDKCAARTVKIGMKRVNEGVSTGIGAVLMLKSVEDKIDNINILVPVRDGITDPKYAELAIQNINNLMKLEIDVTELEKEAKMVEAKINELIEKNKSAHQTLKGEPDQAGPSMYA